MGLSQADAARRLNVSHSMAHRLWNQYETEAHVTRRQVPGRPQSTTPAGNSFITLSARRRRRIPVPQLVADHFVVIVVSLQFDQLCVHPSTDDREGPDYLGQENTFPGPDSDVRVIQDVCSSGGNESPDIINPNLLKDTVTEVVG
ncbi:uncharacterized protein TNCV_4014191 [Trichonephila clavipes]|nr:uncharacterized protein TNCV_4014191 [Trichonephila clavipes]